MIEQTGFQIKNVKDVTFSIWKQWLYKSLFQLDRLDLGVAELGTGRTDPSSHATETALYLVLDGRGRFILGGDPTPGREASSDALPFQVGTFVRIPPGQTYRVECTGPSMFLVLRTENRFPQMEAHTIRPGQTISDRILAHPLATCEYRFVAAGELHLLHDGQPLKLTAGTAFQCEAGIRYSIANTSPRGAQLAVASAGILEPSPTAGTR